LGLWIFGQYGKYPCGVGSWIFVITSGYGLLNIVPKKKKHLIKITACSGFLRIFKEPAIPERTRKDWWSRVGSLDSLRTLIKVHIPNHQPLVLSVKQREPHHASSTLSMLLNKLLEWFLVPAGCHIFKLFAEIWHLIKSNQYLFLCFHFSVSRTFRSNSMYTLHTPQDWRLYQYENSQVRIGIVPRYKDLQLIISTFQKSSNYLSKNPNSVFKFFFSRF
jgi:hypothetical protein